MHLVVGWGARSLHLRQVGPTFGLVFGLACKLILVANYETLLDLL